MLTGQGSDAQGYPVAIIGLTGRTMNALLQGEWITQDLGSFPGLPRCTVVLMFGRDEQEIAEHIAAAARAAPELVDRRWHGPLPPAQIPG